MGVAICGDKGSGKATLMRLLGNSLLATSGVVVIPSHLRVLFVSQTPTMLGLSAWSNLTFGWPTARPSRVKQIIKGLGIHHTLSIVEDDLKEMGSTEESEEISHDVDPSAEVSHM